MRRIYIAIAALAMLCVGFTACSSDDPKGRSIFPTDEPEHDNFEQWLIDNYAIPYNVEVKYKMNDIETSHRYNLVPADSAKSAKLAIITKYLWFDAYSEVAGQNFVKASVPRLISFIGSAAYNSNGTFVLGTAEGGYHVTLYMVNMLNDNVFANYATLNYYYFHTMHHEFTHILNQKKPYSNAFDLVTKETYISGDWYLQSNATARKEGYVSSYARSEPREDFAELLAFYVTSSPKEWQDILNEAGTRGADLINQKMAIVKNYMQESWQIDLDQLRDAVLRRGANLNSLDLNHLN